MASAAQCLAWRDWSGGFRRTVAWLDAHGQIENSDDDPFDDRLIAAWRRLGLAMADELGRIED